MDSATKPRVAYRSVLIGMLTYYDEDGAPDVQAVLNSFVDELAEDDPHLQAVLNGSLDELAEVNPLNAFLDELAEANPVDVALGALELVNRLADQLGMWTGQSRAETLRDLAAAVATNPIP